ncbi:MAG: zf-HC2 domain-containing protein, partial [Planctomycetota bacterium]
MKCEKDKETVSRYLSDLMDEAERAGFEAHIAQCEECRAEVARFRRMLVALGDLPRERAPLSVARAIDREAVSRLKGKRPVSLRARWSATVRVAAAAVIVLAVMCSAYFLHLELTKGPTTPVATRPEPGAEKIPAAGERRESVDNWLQERLHDEKAASFARTLSASAVLSGTDLEDVRKKADSLEFGQLLDVIKAYRESAASDLEISGKASVAAVDASVLSARLKQVYLAALNKAEKPSDVGELVESGAVYFPPAAAGEVTLAGYEPENAGGSVNGQNSDDEIEAMREIPDKKTEPLALPKGMEGAPETRDEI